jgi:hypothetical protein
LRAAGNFECVLNFQCIHADDPPEGLDGILGTKLKVDIMLATEIVSRKKCWSPRIKL